MLLGGKFLSVKNNVNLPGLDKREFGPRSLGAGSVESPPGYGISLLSTAPGFFEDARERENGNASTFWRESREKGV